MTVFSVISQKGGAGKTSLAIALAVSGELAGLSTAVIDLDPQATATNWADRRENRPPVVVSAQPARLPHVLKLAADNGAQLIIIDTPPRAEQAALAAAKAADLILIPCRPAVFDLDTVATTLELIRLSGNGQVIVVLNGVPSQGSEQGQARAILEGLGIVVCPATLGQRKAFPQAVTIGQSPQEYDPSGKAAAEIQQVYKYASQLASKTARQGAI
jgi:chromosome partitioning protein